MNRKDLTEVSKTIGSTIEYSVAKYDESEDPFRTCSSCGKNIEGTIYSEGGLSLVHGDHRCRECYGKDMNFCKKCDVPMYKSWNFCPMCGEHYK